MGQIARRIVEFIDKKNIPDLVLREKIGISRATLWRWRNSPGDPKLEFVSRVIQNLPINAFWLLTGSPNVEMEWKGKADEEIEIILTALSKNDHAKKALYNFIKWQDNLSKKGKEDSK